ncbi:hypothetical protein HHI36_010415 [Cryptolaemus montrouzieri]|uniref:DUF4371 domain-containing protein n=1 Tax=Cryptolaemus montrouzieri TaxID=559131 RepID=A0ABD2MIQ4_9CUCU
MFTSASNSQDTKITAKASEAKMACYIAEHNMSFNIVSHLNKLISAICPEFENCRTIINELAKARAFIVNVTGDSRKNIVELLQNNRFALLVDKSTDMATMKHLALVVRIV